uniref:hypothetical protein n=1 Tax=Streptomyces albidochromogenes TaxID=329524 RepID=UPI001ABF25B2
MLCDGVRLPSELGVLWFGVRLLSLPGVLWFGVRPSPATGGAPGVRVFAPPGVFPLGLVTAPGVAPGARPSVDGAGVRGGVDGVGLGVEAVSY